MAKINIRGVYFDNVNMKEALDRSVELLDKNDHSCIFTPNSEIVQLCVEENGMYDIINSADLIIPDGAGVLLASRLLRTPLKEKVAGIELALKIVEHCANMGKRLFLLGSKPESTDNDGKKITSSADEAAKKLTQKYPKLVICGTADGYFNDENSRAIIEKINNSNADVVFVCLGCPRQEKWIYRYKNEINASLLMGLGGSIDVFAGRVKRAPNLFVRLNLEWFYRLIKQPRRLGRMMKIPKFLWQTFLYKNK